MEEQLEIQLKENNKIDSSNNNNNKERAYGKKTVSAIEDEKWRKYQQRDNDSVYPPDWPYNHLRSESTLKEEEDDPVRSPKHYNLFGGKQQVLDLIKDRLTPEEYKGYLKGNMIKYHMRAEHKNGLEDYKKMQMYLQWLVIDEENSTDV
jgi:hypothetical protein